MRVYHFSETAYPHLPPAETLDNVRVVFPNSNYDPLKGSDIYNHRIDEWQIADELGLHIMLNEHHQTATCTVPAVPLIAAILARVTKDARILVLGNPLANRRQPTRIAEEMAMVDVISRGRLECGFIRGVPFELSAQNSNPMRMADRMWEAHDLIVKAWTTHDGPFNWEGRYFHHRQINIWPRPYQQPHPPIWVTVSSPASCKVLAEKKYVAASFLTGFNGAKAVFDGYRQYWKAAHGSEAPTDRWGYLAMAATGETDEEGRRLAEKVLWYINMNKVYPQFARVPGYVSAERLVQMRSQGLSPVGLEFERVRHRARHAYREGQHVLRQPRHGLQADQEVPRPCRRHRSHDADDAGRFDGHARGAEEPDAVRQGSPAAPQGAEPHRREGGVATAHRRRIVTTS